MSLAPKRRWSFSLRTLFVVVTVFGGWLGYELNWIRQRRSVVEIPNIECIDSLRLAEVGLEGPNAPFMLRLLGEPGYKVLRIPMVDEQFVWANNSSNFNPHWPEMGGLEPHLTEGNRAELRRLQRLFPEAEVCPTIK
jgi:hypothetical protein